MSLRYSFKSARNRIARLDAQERRVLQAICRDIHRAQKRLSVKAEPILDRCISDCRGLCCRNLHPSDIITEWDLVFILAAAPQLESAMADGIAREGFFPADCIFLADGVGPCLFPDHLRPERCIISFCRVEPAIEVEIGRVMGGFSRLIRFFMFRPLRRWFGGRMPQRFIHRRRHR